MSNNSADEADFDLKEQDRFLPIAKYVRWSSTSILILFIDSVARIMKKSLPDNAKIAKEAKECVQECVSEFISFITSEYSFYTVTANKPLP